MTIHGEYVTLPGLKAGASLASKQYTPVKLSSTAADTVLSATTTAHIVVGIVMNNPASGDAAEVAALGVAKAIAGTSNLARGESLSCNSTGVVDVTAGKVFGVALEASSAIGDIVTVLLTGPRPY